MERNIWDTTLFSVSFGFGFALAKRFDGHRYLYLARFGEDSEVRLWTAIVGFVGSRNRSNGGQVLTTVSVVTGVVWIMWD